MFCRKANLADHDLAIFFGEKVRVSELSSRQNGRRQKKNRLGLKILGSGITPTTKKITQHEILLRQTNSSLKNYFSSESKKLREKNLSSKNDGDRKISKSAKMLKKFSVKKVLCPRRQGSKNFELQISYLLLLLLLLLLVLLLMLLLQLLMLQ